MNVFNVGSRTFVFKDYKNILTISVDLIIITSAHSAMKFSSLIKIIRSVFKQQLFASALNSTLLATLF